MSAVRACLQDLPKERDIFVEKIFPMNHGRVNVIIADMEGHRSECVIELTTDKIDSHIPIIEPKGPLFVPNRPYRSPPKGTCFDTKLVMIDKRLQGWLLTQNGNCGSTPSWKGIATSVTAPLLRR